MATSSSSREAKKRELLEGFLLGSMVYDAFTLDDLQNAVPPKYRTLAKLRTKRAGLRGKVKENIKKACSARTAASASSVNATGQTAAQAMETLREREAEINEEIKDAQREFEELKEALQQFERELDPDAITKALAVPSLPLNTVNALNRSLLGSE